MWASAFLFRFKCAKRARVHCTSHIAHRSASSSLLHLNKCHINVFIVSGACVQCRTRQRVCLSLLTITKVKRAADLRVHGSSVSNKRFCVNVKTVARVRFRVRLGVDVSFFKFARACAWHYDFFSLYEAGSVTPALVSDISFVIFCLTFFICSVPPRLELSVSECAPLNARCYLLKGKTVLPVLRRIPKNEFHACLLMAMFISPHLISSFLSFHYGQKQKKTQKNKPSNHLLSHEHRSERGERPSKWVCAADRASKAGRSKWTREWCELTDERVAQY